MRALSLGEVGHLASTLGLRFPAVVSSHGINFCSPNCPRQPARVSLCVGNRAPGRHSEPMLVNGASERLIEDPLHPRTLESLVWYGWERIQPSISYPLFTESLEPRDRVALGTHS